MALPQLVLTQIRSYHSGHSERALKFLLAKTWLVCATRYHYLCRLKSTSVSMTHTLYLSLYSCTFHLIFSPHLSRFLSLSLSLAKHEKVSKEIEHEALMTLGHAALMKSDCEQALSLYDRVTTPAAAWNRSQVWGGMDTEGI